MTPEQLKEEAKLSISRQNTNPFKRNMVPVVQVKLRQMLENSEIYPNIAAEYLGLSHTGYHVYNIPAHSILENL
jgi:hypothetical protein